MDREKYYDQGYFHRLTPEQALLHDKAWKMVELIETFVTDPKFSFLQVSEFKLPDSTNLDEILHYDHALDYLFAKYPDEAQRIIYKQITSGMVIDFCYFLQEALSCAKRGRIIVAYSLLRRPLVYNLIILLRMVYDESFYNKFTQDSSYDPTVYKPEELHSMLDEFDQEKILSPINGSIIYELIFDKDNPNSIINLSNRAIHPTTTRKWNLTGEMNFNFIFAIKEDIVNLTNILYHNILAIIAYYFELFNMIILSYAPSDQAKALMVERYEKLAKCMS